MHGTDGGYAFCGDGYRSDLDHRSECSAHLPSRNVTAEETTVECVLRPGRTAVVEAPCRNGCANSAP